MAIRLIDRYPNRVDPATSNYPHGEMRNVSAPGENDGTPLEQDWGNDFNAFFQALVEAAEITPDGNVDTVPNSQYMQSLVQVANGVTEVDVAGGTNVSLNTGQSRIAMVNLTGALTADIDVIFPDTERGYVIINNSSGSFTITCRTSAGTGLTVPQGSTRWVRSDGTNLVAVLNDVSSSVDSVSTLRTSSFPANLERLWLSGYMGVGTGGHGPLYRSSGTDDGGFKFEADDGSVWERPRTNYLYTSWFNGLSNVSTFSGFTVYVDTSETFGGVFEITDSDFDLIFVGDSTLNYTHNNDDFLVISGDNVNVDSPRIAGPGIFNTDTSDPDIGSLVLSGNGSKVKGRSVLTDPVTHGVIVSGTDCDVSGAEIESTFTGISGASAARHQGVRDVGVRSKIHRNTISGFMNGVKLTGAQSSQVFRNALLGQYGHAIYGGGSDESIERNIISSSVSSSTAIVTQGKNAFVERNLVTGGFGLGGITSRDGQNVTISENIIIDSSDSGANTGIVATTTLTTDDILNVKVLNNTVIFNGTTSGQGIFVNASDSLVSECEISGNKIENACLSGGEGAIQISSNNPGINNTISGNTLNGSSVNAIWINNANHNTISDNKSSGTSSSVVDLRDSSDNVISENHVVNNGASLVRFVRETNISSQCERNSLADNKIDPDVDVANKLSMESSDYSLSVPKQSKTWTLSGATTFYPLDGFVHLVDPNVTGDRGFSPGGQWPEGAVVSIFNTSSTADNDIDFNNSGTIIGPEQNKDFVFINGSWSEK